MISRSTLLRIVAYGGLGLAAVLPPWEFYSCCHGGFGFAPYVVGPAGRAPLFLPPQSFPNGVRVDVVGYAVQMGVATLGTCGLLVMARRLMRTPPSVYQNTKST